MHYASTCRNINLPHIILGVSDIPVIDKEVDAAGLKCPEPVMMLHNALANLDKGKVVLMKATDPTTIRDVRNFCTYLGHELIHQDEDNGIFSYTIRKKTQPTTQSIPQPTTQPI